MGEEHSRQKGIACAKALRQRRTLLRCSKKLRRAREIDMRGRVVGV